MIRAWLRWFWACLVYAGYWFRPYDMLADRRRWFWQPRTYCGFPISTKKRKPTNTTGDR